ncbi:peptidase M50 [Methanocaldococcus vulcanius M7]|uniref:Zinc metalloprotease n=1 Tax=Methanocaldococcus vulcanius (strain ATCC 700851 / DSM 12094 / M7) TaxID=579137 RepID=C9RIC7_METVM|nr:site-2 protease family protein [Methanocaldococcus vulcanius]ACX73329.1 peptidase M50 [Methanocaldococcus vulcanius M7]
MYSIRLFKIMGIPIELHITFILFLIIIVAFSIIYDSIFWAILFILLFVSVVLHELGHSYVAKKYGVRIEKILLLPIGGVAMMDKIPKEGELKIGIAGPLVSFAIGISLLVISRFFDVNVDGYPLLYTLSLLNLILGGFNLIPAFPMDGGRILRAILSKKYGYLKSTKIAVNIGKILALIMLLLGLLSMNVMLILVSLFVYFGAEQEGKVVEVDEVFKNIKAKDIMTPNPICVSPDMSIEEFLDFMLKHKYFGYPVVEDGKLVGCIGINNIHKKDGIVRDYMEDPVLVDEDEDIKEVLKKMSHVDRVFVVKNGKLEGIISKTDILRAMNILELKEELDSQLN